MNWIDQLEKLEKQQKNSVFSGTLLFDNNKPYPIVDSILFLINHLYKGTHVPLKSPLFKSSGEYNKLNKK